MTEPLKTIDAFTKTAGAWIGIGGAIFGVLSFFMLVGMWFGPLKELPAQYDVILGKLNMMEGRMDKTDWAIDSLKARTEVLANQIIASNEDKSKIWDRLRSVDSDASNLKGTSLTREDMVEWAAALGSRNKTLSVPPLLRNRE